MTENPNIYVLVHPITIDQKTTTTIILKQPTLLTLKALTLVERRPDQLSKVIASVSDLPPEVIENISLPDAMAITETVANQLAARIHARTPRQKGKHARRRLM